VCRELAHLAVRCEALIEIRDTSTGKQAATTFEYAPNNA
jgi:hypothetical protein